jgi:hypothetical protein
MLHTLKTLFYATFLFLPATNEGQEKEKIPIWAQGTQSNDVHFIKRGRMIGSLNYAHLVLDINLANIESNITKLCQVTQNITDTDQTTKTDMAGDLLEISGAIHEIEIERCLLLAEDYANTVNVWLDAPQEIAVKATRFRTADGVQRQGVPIFSKQGNKQGRSTDPPRAYGFRAAEEEVPEQEQTWWGEVNPALNDTYEPYFKFIQGDSKYIREYMKAKREVEKGWGRRMEMEEERDEFTPMLEVLHAWELILEAREDRSVLDEIYQEAIGVRPAPGTTSADARAYIMVKLERHSHLTGNTGIVWSSHPGITIGSWVMHMAAKEDKKQRRGRRVKRQFFILGFLIAMGIAAIGSYLFSQSQVAQLSVSTGTDEHAVQVMQDHETKTAVNNRSIEILKLSEREDKKRIYSLDMVTLQIMASLTKDEAEKEIRRIITAVQLLSKNRLSPDLVQTDRLGQVVTALKDKASRKGLVLGITTKEDIFRVDTSHIFFLNRTLRIFVHVPAYREDGLLDLYEYIPVPIPLTQSKFVIPAPAAGLLAVSPGKLLFRTMSHSALHDCDRLLDLYFCHRQNLYDKRYTDDCMVALYNSDYAKVGERCPILVQPKEDFLVQLNSSHFVLYQPELGDVERRCGGIIDRARLRGLYTVHVGAGCRVDSRSYIFDGALAIYSEGSELQQRVMNFSKVVPRELRDELEQLNEKELAELKLVGSTKGVYVRDLVKEFADRRRNFGYTVGLGSLIAVVGLIVLCLCCGRLEHLRRRQRETGSVFYHRAAVDPPPKQAEWRGDDRGPRKHDGQGGDDIELTEQRKRPTARPRSGDAGGGRGSQDSGRVEIRGLRETRAARKRHGEDCESCQGGSDS